MGNRFDDAAKNYAGKITLGKGGKVQVVRESYPDSKDGMTERSRAGSQKNTDLRPERKGGR